MIAVVALVASAYTGLQWTEAEASQNELDSQSLRVDFEAPTRSALGPWEKGHLFTGDSIGVPLQLAPEWRVTATFQQKVSTQGDGEWKAKLYLREKGPGGRDWWSQSHDLEPSVEGDRAHLDVNMSHWVDEAQRMAAEASVPGDLEIEIAIQHSTKVMTRDGESATSRTARILVELRDELVIAKTHDDTARFHEDVPKDPPWTGIGAAGLAFVSGGFALYARRRHPKHPVEGAIMVESLRVPENAVETDSEGISHLARHTSNPILFDVHNNVLLLTGEIPVVVRLGATKGQKAESREMDDKQ